MLKSAATVLFILFGLINSYAQQLASKNTNPFSQLRFINGPTDTVTIIGNYNNVFGEIAKYDSEIIASITRNGGAIAKKMNYAIGFTITGYEQKFYAACKDISLLRELSSKQKVINKLKLTCIVYRFYYVTNTCNFFYIDKADILD